MRAKTKLKVYVAFLTIVVMFTTLTITSTFVIKEPKMFKVDNDKRLILDYDFSSTITEEEKEYLNSALLENKNALTIFVADTNRFDSEVAKYYVETLYTDKDIPYVVIHYNYMDSRLEYCKSDNVKTFGDEYQYIDNAHYTQVYKWIPNITSEVMVILAAQNKFSVVIMFFLWIAGIIFMLALLSEFMWKSNGILKYRETFFGAKVKIKIDKKRKDILKIQASVPDKKINCVVFSDNNDLTYEERIIRVVFKDKDVYYAYSFGSENLEKIEWSEEEIIRTFNNSRYFKYTIPNNNYEEESIDNKEDNQEEEN